LLIEGGTQRVLDTSELEEVEAAPSDDPYGAVVAANRALGRLLDKVAAFAAEHARR
jgi:cholesterol transport system auxiliary component